MKKNLAALISGFLFAIGLGISGMTLPKKVFGFLDLFGNWDPSLMFVMVGAIAVHGLTYKLITGRPHPVLSKEWHLPAKQEVTRSLVFGSAIFGIGWALAGYCPGPAITSLAGFESRPLIFVASMIFGMFIFKSLKVYMENSAT